MAKRLNSETRLNKNGLKIKVGTTNRLNPNTVYIDFGGYIIPQEDEEKYDSAVNQLDCMFKKRLKSKLLNNSYFDRKHICVIETAHERMKQGKSSYISVQCHLKQKGNVSMPDIIHLTEEFTKELSDDFSNIVESNGFSLKD